MKRYSKWLKFAASVLFIAFITIAIGAVIRSPINKSVNSYSFYDLLTAYDYTETSRFNPNKFNALNTLSQVVRYKSEQEILDGITLTEAQLASDKDNLFYNNFDIIRERLHIETGRDNFSEFELRTAFEEYFAGEIAQLHENRIQQDLTQYRDARDQLANFRENGIVYYYTVGDEIFTNVEGATFDSVSGLKYSWILGGWNGGRNGDGNDCVVALSDEYIAEKNAEFLPLQAEARQSVTFIVSLCAGALLCLVYLIFAAGRKDSGKKIYLNIADKLYTEFALALVLGAFALGVVYILEMFYYNGSKIAERGLFYAALVPVPLITAIILAFFLSLVRRLKDGTLLRHTLIYAVFSRIFCGIYRVYSGGKLMRKAATAVILLGLVTMIPFVGIITVPLAVWFVSRKVKMFNTLQDGVFAVAGGDYAGDITTESMGEFKALTESVNSIKNGLNDEVERRLKAERMRTELISNVSHDIRTPLTSVITYVDLLKSEETDNENIRKYVEIIEQKAARLKTLTDDLFEASKATSGNLPVTLERVDIVSLLTQGIGELDDKVKASGLDFRVQTPEGKLFVQADGPLLWRVVENMLSNVFKYSLPGSRVYVSVIDNGGNAGIEVKNISESPLNIPENELLERFKRGDESRSDGGSGLGLAIARSLMAAQGGGFEIKIDGDLFKAALTVPKYEGLE